MQYLKIYFLFPSAVFPCLSNDIALKGLFLHHGVVFSLFCVAIVISLNRFLRAYFRLDFAAIRRKKFAGVQKTMTQKKKTYDLENDDLENDDLENDDLENNALENDDLENNDLENDDREKDEQKTTTVMGQLEGLRGQRGTEGGK